MIQGFPWEGYIPCDATSLLLYAIGNHAFPSQRVLWPSACFYRPKEGLDFPVLLGDPVMSGTWLEEVDWLPRVWVSGECFLAKGLAAFYPELRAWDEHNSRLGGWDASVPVSGSQEGDVA